MEEECIENDELIPRRKEGYNETMKMEHFNT
jgi:hypothetical protein